MTRRLTPQTTLDHLKKEAKRWLKALRSGDPVARARLEAANPKAPTYPVLRDVQHAIAREYEFTNWSALKQAVETQPAPEPKAQDSTAELTTRFLEYACPDHHVRGRPAHRMARHAAWRLLEQHRRITRADLYTAVVCGEIEEVEHILRERPEMANAKRPASGPARSGGGGNYDFLGDLGGKVWTPLLFLSFTRLDLPQANDNAVAMARLLLQHGADPNAYFMAGDSRYTPLTGVIGEGEEDRPPHPSRDELARVLLECGAEPYDQQVNYNIHFHGHVLWWLKLMHEFSVKAGRAADWADPEWRMLDAGGYGSGARWHLWIAVSHNDLELAKWCLEHGANPNAEPPRAQTLPQASLYEQAVRLGTHEMAELLAHHGASRVEVAVDDEDRFVAACLKLDRDEATRMAAKHPEFLQSIKAIFAATKQNRADVVAFLLELGTPTEVEDARKQRALHVAAWANAVDVARLLIERGAEVDPLELNYSNTPLDFAVWADLQPMIELLIPYSRDVWSLVPLGALQRLREVIAAEPRLAKVSGQSTLLFWLPEDEDKAVEIAKLLLENGADPNFRDQKNGTTAAEVARRRGLHRAAALLEAAEGGENESEAQRKAHLLKTYEELARDLVAVYAADDAKAMARINQHYSASYAPDDIRALVWQLMYKVRQAKSDPNAFQLPEAQEFVARTAGFPNWTALTEAAAANQPAPGPAYAFNKKETRIRLRRIPSSDDWDTIIGVMKERRIPALEARMMTDEALRRISQLDFVSSLSLGGSRGMSDDGMQFLANMPQLEHLELSEYPGGKLTDRGLEVLRHLPNLRKFEMTWQKGISDSGAANLRLCHNLEEVNLMGTATGDGAIEALRGKPNLHHFSSGRLVTDAGLPMLHDFPRFRQWHAGECRYSLMSPGEEPAYLLIDGPISDAGLTHLAALDGISGLHLFWHIENVTAIGIGVLAGMRNLRHFRCRGELIDDAAMAQVARMPHLRMLVAQGTVATDDGFEALSRSRTIEYLWGRECPNLGNRGFMSLAALPTLRGLGVSCQNVDDDSLAVLPRFASLRELMPMDVTDHGFRHVGRCDKLEKLWCMYCRETGDVATEHVASLRLKHYYAGLTQVTNRSLEILGRMDSLEVVELFETKSITDAGLAHLAKLPRLRRIELSGLPRITIAGTQVFPAGVEVNHDV